MKCIKLTMGVLLLTIITCGASVFAADNVAYYDNIKLPRLAGTYTLGPRTKKTTKAQSYMNYSTIDACTAANKDMRAQVYYEKSGSSKEFSSWITVSPGSTSEWGNANTKTTNSYNIQLKTADNGWCTSTHIGNWYLDRNI